MGVDPLVAYQKTSSLSPGKCVLVNASSMTKTINNYDTFRGKADISMTFKNSALASVVESAECFLIRNTK